MKQLEDQNLDTQAEFSRFQEQAYSKIGRLTCKIEELTALKKSLTQHFTTQACSSSITLEVQTQAEKFQKKAGIT